MHFRFLRACCAFVCAFLCVTTFSQAEVAPEIVIWPLDNLTVLGNAPLDVWGSPALTRDTAGPGIRFDGKKDGLLVPVIPVADWSSFTIEILFSPDPDGLPEQRFLHLEDEKGRRVLIELRLLPDGHWCLDTFLYSDSGNRLTLIDRSKTHPAGQWYWAALSYADGRMTHFVDGVKECEGSVRFEPMRANGRTSLGVRQNKVSWFRGVIREVRFTPAGLSAEGLQRVRAK